MSIDATLAELVRKQIATKSYNINNVKAT